jgi:hypothetical protein
MLVGLDNKPDVYVEESKKEPGVNKETTPGETASEAEDGRIENNDISTKGAIEPEPEPEDEEKDNTALETVEKEAE